MRILIVEDEESLADVIATRLKKDKYVVDGEEYIQQILWKMVYQKVEI